jgi:chromosome segregation ATPase
MLYRIELHDVQGKLQRESANGTSLAQNLQQLESKLRFVTSKAEELEGSLAGSRSERERLVTLLRDAEAGPSFRLPLVSVLILPLARQQLDTRLRDALNAVSDLEGRLGITQQELKDAWNQASQHQQTISLLVSEKNALAASAERLAELEPRRWDCFSTGSLSNSATFE